MPLLETKGAASAQGFGGAGAGASGPVTYIEDVFSTYLYTGNGSTQTITNGIDLSGKGGLVWAKSRSTITFHDWEDTVRGAGNAIYSNSTNASDYSANRITSFNSDGYSLGSVEPNVNNRTYASWTFRKQPKFFDVVTYTGNGTSISVNHNLGSTPGCIIIKRTNNVASWMVYHRSLTNPTNYYLSLNLTNAQTDWGSTWITATSTSFTLSGANGLYNGSSDTYVAYLFAHNAGGFGLTGSDNVISCGSFTTGTSGKISAPVNLGYEVQWLLVKNIGASENWQIYDVMRGMPVSNGIPVLYPNLSDAEYFGPTSSLAPTATGFNTPTAAGPFANSSTYIYIAIRRGPMKTPTSGTSVYNAALVSGNGTARTISGIGFPSDLVISKGRSASTSAAWVDRLRGAKLDLASAATAAELSDPNGLTGLDNMDGFYLGTDPNGYFNYSGFTYVDWCMRRAPGFFDVVCYTGTGSATTQTHNLGVAPELMIVKMRSGTNPWPVYASAQGATKYTTLNSNSAFSTAGSSTWNNTSPTASVFSVGNSAEVNGSGSTYVAYLFATVSGVSKVGSYTGTGALQTINCGFTGGARFVLIKRTDSTGDWYVYDSARGISSGNDPYLFLNSTAAEVTGTNYVDTTSVGFQVTAAAPADLNANGGTYIFLAIA